MRFSFSCGGHIGLFAIRPPGGYPNLFAVVFRNLISIPITVPNFKNLSPSARFYRYMAYSSPATKPSIYTLHTMYNYIICTAHMSQFTHYNDVIMSAMASQITSFAIVYSTVYSGADLRKHQSSASLAFVRGIHRWPVNCLHKGPVTRKMFPFDNVIMTPHDMYRLVQHRDMEFGQCVAEPSLLCLHW